MSRLRLRLAALAAGAMDTADRSLRYEAMRRFVYAPRPDDVFVVSYPKSGTTLMQMMLLQLTTDGDLSRFPHLDAFSPWFEYDLDLHPDTGPFLESLPSPRVFKSHLRRGWLPKRGRFIYLLRDLQDVALSAHHHFMLMSGREVELDPFVDAFLAGHPMFASGTWSQHLRSWWPYRGDPNVLFVDYDEMIADLSGTIRRVADFCGIEVPEAEMPRIVERCGIAYMRAHEPFFQPRLHAREAPDRGALGRGVPGAGRRELSARQRRLLAEPLAALARELGEEAEPGLLLRPPAPAPGLPIRPAAETRRYPHALAATLDVLGSLSRRTARARTRARLDLALARFRPRPDDVFLAGFPRSGLSLLQMALYQLTTDGEVRFGHVATVSPLLELELADGASRCLEELPAPRFLKTYLEGSRLPRGGRVVYLARNVFDVAVSLYRFRGLVAGHALDLDEFLEEFLAGEASSGVTWFDHLRSWWPRRRDPDVLFLDYDDAVADLPGTLRRLAAFCGLPLDPGELPRMVERCGLDFMKRHEARFDPRLRHVSGTAERFIRKGESGGGKAALSPRHRERIAREVADLGRRLGCRPGDPHARLFGLG